jgi:hypothetical protein
MGGEMTRRQFFAAIVGALTLNPKKLLANFQGLLKPVFTPQLCFDPSIHPLVSYDLVGRSFTFHQYTDYISVSSDLLKDTEIAIPGYRSGEKLDLLTRKIIDEGYLDPKYGKPPSG